MRFFKHNWKKTFYGNNGPYLTVYEIFTAGLRGRWELKICLHEFHRGDEDPDCHDHPLGFMSIILRGGYHEYVPSGSSVVTPQMNVETRWPGTILFRPAVHRHRVELIGKKCWTFVIKAGKPREWGFWKDGQFIPWENYIKAKGLQPIS